MFAPIEVIRARCSRSYLLLANCVQDHSSDTQTASARLMPASPTSTIMEQIYGPSSLDEPATDPSAHVIDVATTQPPFFRLPRELRDGIYDLVALSEETLYCDITLRADGPSQKTTEVHRGDRVTFSKSQFEVEYSAAIEKRVKSLMAGRDRNGLELRGPGRLEYVLSAHVSMVKAKELWLEVSKGRRENGHIGHNIHALVLIVPLHGGLGYTVT